MPTDTNQSSSTLTGLSAELSETEKQQLADWLAEILGIRESNATKSQKLKQTLLVMKNNRSLWPVVRVMYARSKRYIWDERKGGFRAFLLGAFGGILLFGFQGAGIAALGGAIGLPLWIVFGGGAAAAYALLSELRNANKE